MIENEISDGILQGLFKGIAGFLLMLEYQIFSFGFFIEICLASIC
jgi:hypothetical protein